MTYAGVQVGKVKEIRLDPQGRHVDVVLSMFRFRSFKYVIKKDAAFMVKRTGLLGDVYITINPGSEEAAEAEPGETLIGKAPTSLSEMAETAEDLLNKVNLQLDRISTEFLDDQTLADLRQSVKNIKELTANMNSTSAKLNKVLDDVNEGKGTIGSLIQNKEIFENFKALSYNLRKGGVLFYKDRYEQDQGKTPVGEKKERNEAAPKTRR